MAMSMGGKVDAPTGSILLVVHDFIARSADELSLAKGDRIELIERDDDFGDGWFLGRHLNNGNTGLFPEGKQTSSNHMNVRARAEQQQFILRLHQRAPCQTPPSMAHAARPRTCQNHHLAPTPQHINGNLLRLTSSDQRAPAVQRRAVPLRLHPRPPFEPRWSMI